MKFNKNKKKIQQKITEDSLLASKAKNEDVFDNIRRNVTKKAASKRLSFDDAFFPLELSKTKNIERDEIVENIMNHKNVEVAESIQKLNNLIINSVFEKDQEKKLDFTNIQSTKKTNDNENYLEDKNVFFVKKKKFFDKNKKLTSYFFISLILIIFPLLFLLIGILIW